VITLGVLSGIQHVFWTRLPSDHLPVDVISAQGSLLARLLGPHLRRGASVRCRGGGDDLDVLRYVRDAARKSHAVKERDRMCRQCVVPELQIRNLKGEQVRKGALLQLHAALITRETLRQRAIKKDEDPIQNYTHR
jgi:hypothetical protein